MEQYIENMNFDNNGSEKVSGDGQKIAFWEDVWNNDPPLYCVNGLSSIKDKLSKSLGRKTI